ncbi:MAG: glucose-1-phosphate adenylyltransferase subunit GlgD [Anaerovibrio sp.]|uniref:glucose-1-phosphate adenylyltransferase subunit GlgD n=1 Tax=Anaerovibrio sp. TaxID=1872532 RepID=UPI0025FAD858|nr:glucose-1-phosphate adenylyltransferase subunit GlgD [Anaerovibrio sp.]MCR5176755.1 glucose-1-phosphate adenylyltransferase subunit GlgD [Anaerovibrio sp.]
MSNMMGIIKLDGAKTMLKELSDRRPVAALPMAGRYRLVDFALSSMVNSGIDHVGVLLPNKARPVFDHLRSGKDWDLARHREGMVYLPCDTDGHREPSTLATIYYNLDYIKHSSAEYVLFAQADTVYNIDFRSVLLFHQNTGADITMVYSKASADLPGDAVAMEIAGNGRVNDIAKHLTATKGSNDFIGIYLMAKETFINLVSIAFERGGNDFLLDGIIKHMAEYSIYAYEHKGFVSRVNSTMAYFNANKSLLNTDVWNELFMGENSIRTKTKDATPVQYKDNAHVVNSLVANGCEIDGEVENSILFRGVKIGEGVKIKDCIIMEQCQIEENAMLRDVICDKNVFISADQWLKGSENYPLVVAKGTII